MPACCSCDAIERHFSADRAAEELASYARRGPTGTARLMLQALRKARIRPDSLLDVGAGVGVLHHELLSAGAGSAVHVEASRAYLDAARAEAARRGLADRVRFLHGDFLALAPTRPEADLVTLDRVVCCYPDFEPLVRASVAGARRYYAISYPHDRWYVRVYTAWENARRRRAGSPFRTFVHPPPRIRALISEGGLHVVHARKTAFWEVLLCTRASPGTATPSEHPVTPPDGVT